MGGKSSSEQSGSQNQTSTTNPWGPSQGLMQGILGQLQGGLGATGLSPDEKRALSSWSSNAQGGNPYAGLLDNLTKELFAGGGATNQAGAINQNYAEYMKRLNPIANGEGMGPGGNPMLQKYLDVSANDIQTRVNGMFAGAGRDLSGQNVQSLSRGITEGTAPILANQYNTDFTNMRGAQDALYGAGNMNAGLLAGLQQQALQNKMLGAGMADNAWNAQNAGAKELLQIEAMRRGIPMQALGLLAQIGIPIAGLGGTTNSSGTSKGYGVNNMSGAQQFALIGQGIGSMMPKFAVPTGK